MSSGHPCLLNCHLTQVSLPASNRDRDWEGQTSLLVTSLLVTSPRMDPRSLRKTFLSCKIGKRSGEEFHLRGAEQRICNHKFSKVNVLRKKKVRDLWSGRKLSKVQSSWGECWGIVGKRRKKGGRRLQGKGRNNDDYDKDLTVLRWRLLWERPLRMVLAVSFRFVPSRPFRELPRFCYLRTSVLPFYYGCAAPHRPPLSWLELRSSYWRTLGNLTFLCVCVILPAVT